MINTTAKYLLEDVDFSGEGAHLAMTLNEFGGSAAKARDEEGAYLYKSKELSEDAKAFIEDLEKSELEKADGDLPNSAFAYVPDPDKTSSRKLRIDDANHTRAAVAALGAGFRGNKVEIPESDMAAVKRKVRSAYRKFFPENDMPEVLKSLENKDSDAMSESNNNTADIGINKNNKEENMADSKVETQVDVTKSEEFLELQKSVKEMTDLWKSEKEAREAAEAKAEEIAKAAEAERIEKAKADLTEVVKGWDIEKCEGVTQEGLVEALFKAEQAELIMKTLEHLNDRIDTLKSEFGKEEGLGGEIKAAETDVQKTHTDVSAILKARAEKAKAAKARK